MSGGLLIALTSSHSGTGILVLVLVALEGVRSQRRIISRQGLVELSTDEQVNWRQQSWLLDAPPWLSRWMILLKLRGSAGQREWLWIFADSMPPAKWRILRQHLLMQIKPD